MALRAKVLGRDGFLIVLCPCLTPLPVLISCGSGSERGLAVPQRVCPEHDGTPHQPPEKVGVLVWGVPHPLCFLSHWVLTVRGRRGRQNRLELQAGVASWPPGETVHGFHGVFKGGCDSENGRDPLSRTLLGFPAFQCKLKFPFKGQPSLVTFLNTWHSCQNRRGAPPGDIRHPRGAPR